MIVPANTTELEHVMYNLNTDKELRIRLTAKGIEPALKFSCKNVLSKQMRHIGKVYNLESITRL